MADGSQALMDKLHILTAVSRPTNLDLLLDSIMPAVGAFDVHWWLVGPEKDYQHRYERLIPVTVHCIEHPNSAGGQMQKNAAIDQITDGWMWILDDDNIACPGFFAMLSSTLAASPHAGAVVFSQRMKDGPTRLIAAPQFTKLCHIDAAQFVVRRQMVGNYRIPDHYCGDGEFIETLYKEHAPFFMYVPDPPLVYYNALRS